MTHPLEHKIAELSEAILASHPTLPTLLQTIHRTLKNDPAVVTLLSPEEVAVIVSGLQKQTGVVLAGSASKPSTSVKKSLKNATLDDFGF